MYASLEPETAYVGSTTCASCHQEIHQQYRQTNMGHSFYRPDQQDTIEHFGKASIVYDSTLDFFYQPFWREGEFFIREWRTDAGDTTYLREEQVDYVIGSGHQTRSYLMQRNGYLYEMPITWYVHRKIWDLSPGYRESNSRFSREIGSECMSCHTGTFDFTEGSKNRFDNLSLGIGCENCHGPGEKHVEFYRAGGTPNPDEIDHTIVNPADLPLNVSFDICSRCHLEGVAVPQPGKTLDSYRPGMPLQEAMEVFVMQNRDQEAFGVASHAERLMQARCFIASDGQLSCNTCHDSHHAITDPQVYISQCQSCHQDASEAGMCLSPESEHMSAEQNCISCHMPAGGTVDIPHVRFHDHKIRVLGRETETPDVATAREWLELKCGTSDNPSPNAFGQAWLLYYEQQDRNPRYLDRAWEQLGPEQHYERVRIAFYREDYALAKKEIEQALDNAPQDPLRLFLKGEILENLGFYGQAHDAFIQVYDQNQENIEAGLKAGTTLLKANQGDIQVLGQARTLFETLLRKKPFDTRMLTNLGFITLNQRELPTAESYLVRALRQDPDDAQALENMVLVQLVKGNDTRAEHYLKHLEERHPEHASLDKLKGMLEQLQATRS